jgi:hypothetical protein
MIGSRPAETFAVKGRLNFAPSRAMLRHTQTGGSAMGKKHKKKDETPETEVPVVSDSDDGSTQTETDAFLGEDDPTNENGDFGC